MKGEITKREFIGPENYLLWVKPEKQIKFIPGQFMNIRLDGKTRSYSIASLPEEDSLLFYIKRVPNGFMSNKLAELPIGAELELLGPFGHMTVDKVSEDKVVFIAAGTGIAPVRPMAYWCYRNNKKAIIIHQEKYENLLVFKEEFEKWGEYYAILSREEKTKYLKGHVQDYIDRFLYNDANYVIIGSAKFVGNVYKLLLDKGVTRDKIIIESFGNI